MTTLNESHYINYLAHMLDEAMLTEGKHWPEDYKKTAFNTIKNSELGKQEWYSDDFIRQDIDTIATNFIPLAHRNSNLGYFAAVIRWFCQYAGSDRAKYQEFIEQKLDAVIQYLQLFVNDESLVEKYRDDVKQKFTYEQFIDLMKPISNKMKQDADNTEFEVVDKGYEIIPIMSYQELHKQFGGRRTGYKGQSMWCHTNGSSTYASWTSNWTKFFFILAKKSWKEIKPPKPETTNAYDEYGTSLMAILVSRSGKLLNCTLRWNHVIDLAETKPGRTADNAFISFAELSQVTGLDVKAEVDALLEKIIQKVNEMFKHGSLVYRDKNCKCYATDKLTWYNRRGKEIQPPEIATSYEFNCSNTELTSLAGCPREVQRFDCYNTKITSLAGAPQKVESIFCQDTQITSLVGGPEFADFYQCGGSYETGHYGEDISPLVSLEGMPKKVKVITCSNAALTSLEGMPVATRTINLAGMTKLTDLTGLKCDFNNNDYHYISIIDCPSLTSLAGLPEEMTGRLMIQNCQSLTSLAGCPKRIDGTFQLQECRKIRTLEGGPSYVGTLNISENSLTSLKGAPGRAPGSPTRLQIYANNSGITPQQRDAYLNWYAGSDAEDNIYQS